jgi:4a-hydroxytetrahydrobiopterin dehydratase
VSYDSEQVSGDAVDDGKGVRAKMGAESNQRKAGVTDLVTKRCKPCEGGVAPLALPEARALLPQVPGWAVGSDARSLSREFSFDDFHQTMAFVNAVAWVAHEQDHHPDLEVGYRRCRVTYSTHAIGGLSENDFICAARIGDLLV